MTGWQGDQQHGGWDQPGSHPGYAQAPASQGGFGGPQRPSRLPAVLGILAIVVIVGTVVTIILLNRPSTDPVAEPGTSSSAPPDTTTASRPPSTTGSAPTTSGRPPTTSAVPGGGTVVDNPAARLRYQVPPDWKADESATAEVLDVEFSGIATASAYACEGGDYSRAFVTSAAVQNSNKQDIDPAKAANSFAAAFAEKFYPKGTVAGTPAVREGKIGGKKAITLTATVGTTPSTPNCEATGADITVVAVDLDNATADHPSGVALLVVVRDRAGGPADPAPVPDAVVAGILGSLQVS